MIQLETIHRAAHMIQLETTHRAAHTGHKILKYVLKLYVKEITDRRFINL
jgi:hypothetical protein